MKHQLNFRKERIMNTSKALFLLGAALIALSCDRYQVPVEPKTEQPPFSLGSLDTARYVAIGNSLTAGFQSNALSSRDQAYSYPALLAAAFRIPQANFQQPLIREPGIGARKKLTSFTLTPTGGVAVIVDEVGVNPLDPASNLNGALPRPYNNLGIPGAVLFDMLDTTNFTTKSIARQNPFFAQILRNNTLLGRSLVAQARALRPTFMTCWIGNNDVLGYATGGGANPASLTAAATFNTLYRQLMDSLRSITPNVVVANIADVTTIPFFSTLASSVAPVIPPGVQLRYQRGTNRGASFDSTRLTAPYGPPYFTLIGSTWAPFLGKVGGQGGGKYYSDNRSVFPTLPAGIDTTKPFGFHPQNPWPTALVLDDAEAATAIARIADFNRSIDSLARNRGFAVVNMNAVLRDIAARGRYVPGYGTFSTAFISGGAFSYDGVHPTSRGSVLMANEFIKVINAKYGATIPLIDYGSVPQQQGFGPGGAAKVTGEFGSFDFYVDLLKNTFR
jgi:lysophospholipase L1-like esterase